MKRSRIRFFYYWFMIFTATALCCKLIYLIVERDKEMVFSLTLLTVVGWLIALIYTDARIKKRPGEEKLLDQFNILAFVFTLLPIVVTYRVVVNVIDGEVDIPISYIFFALVSDVFFILSIMKVGKIRQR